MPGELAALGDAPLPWTRYLELRHAPRVDAIEGFDAELRRRRCLVSGAARRAHGTALAATPQVASLHAPMRLLKRLGRPAAATPLALLSAVGQGGRIAGFAATARPENGVWSYRAGTAAGLPSARSGVALLRAGAVIHAECLILLYKNQHLEQLISTLPDHIVIRQCGGCSEAPIFRAGATLQRQL